MKIQYVGPRPEISQHGITFKTGKEDKYVYLQVAVQILKAIDNNSKNDRTYSYNSNEKTLNDADMLAIMLEYEPSLEESIIKEKQAYSKHLDSELEHIEHREHMNELDKQIYIENFLIMKEYRLQRAVNKMYYMHCIKEIVDVIKREKIKEIDTPFQEKYWHILQTIEGEIMTLKSGIKAELKIERDKENKLIAKLLVGGYPT